MGNGRAFGQICGSAFSAVFEASGFCAAEIGASNGHVADGTFFLECHV